MQPENPAFRTDINGLRAYAVLAVLLFHFGISEFASGFIGVDVFFVISGFLMSALILPKLRNGSFSLGAFYTARIRRIFPALAVLCAVLLVLGWFTLGPSDFRALGKHVASSAAFLSNFIYRAEEGYFDAPSRVKWLLHTWSLAVEAQFYLFFPLLLISLRHYTHRTLLLVLWSIAAISFALSIIYTPTHNAFTFYLLPARAWELLAGSLTYLHAPRLRMGALGARLLELLGLSIIVASAMLFTSSTLWPGYHALLPVSGAVLVLLAARQHSLFTDNVVARYVGLWSYSIYLWHWPLVVALYYHQLFSNNAWTLGCFALSFILGAASYYGIEQPARRFARENQRTFYRPVAVMAALLIGFGAWIYAAHGFENRLPEPIRIADREANNRTEFRINCGFDAKRGTLTPCPVGDGTPVRYVLWGDSHVGNIATALRDTVKGGIEFFSHACPTMFDIEIYSKDLKNRCRDFNELVYQHIQTLPKDTAIIIANRYAVNIEGPNEGSNRRWGFMYYDTDATGLDRDPMEVYKQQFAKSICRIAAVRPVYLMKPTPEFGFDIPRTQVRRMIFGQDQADVTMKLADYRARNHVVLQAIEGAARQCRNVTVVDPIPYVCDGDSCAGTRDGRPLYVDDNHLSNYGNRQLMPLFASLFRRDVRSDWKANQQKAGIGPLNRNFH